LLPWISRAVPWRHGHWPVREMPNHCVSVQSRVSDEFT
jgi:hypothetical protein